MRFGSKIVIWDSIHKNKIRQACPNWFVQRPPTTSFRH